MHVALDANSLYSEITDHIFSLSVTLTYQHKKMFDNIWYFIS